MKRFKQFAAFMLLATGVAFIGAGCQGNGEEAEAATSMPSDHPHAEHPTGDHPKADHPKAEHPTGDHPK